MRSRHRTSAGVGLTFVATLRGFFYVASVIDAYARRIVGRRVSSDLRSDLALDALKQAIHDRLPTDGDSLIQHVVNGGSMKADQ